MYKYETHCHTSEVSKCSHITAEDLVSFYKDEGFSGVFITDHFFNGNTTVECGQKWEKMVEDFCEGFKKASKKGSEIGIDVFFAFEYSYHGTDVLVYGLDETWLLNHPDVLQLGTTDFCDFARSEGALLIHAHPYREASYIDMIRLFPRKVDGVEIYNACRTDFENDRAAEYAENYALLCSAGTDNHVGFRESLGGMEFNEKITSVSDFVLKMKTGKGKIFRMDL